MTPSDLVTLAIVPALCLLPSRMDSRASRAMLVAMAVQESGLIHRRQLHDGPARGWWQFEVIGVNGVMRHHATQDYAAGLCKVFGYPLDPYAIHAAIEHNDALAAGFARLALWPIPHALPDGRMDEDLGWRQYLQAWRPGKPRRETWHDSYSAGWAAV